MHVYARAHAYMHVNIVCLLNVGACAEEDFSRHSVCGCFDCHRYHPCCHSWLKQREEDHLSSISPQEVDLIKLKFDSFSFFRFCCLTSAGKNALHAR